MANRHCNAHFDRDQLCNGSHPQFAIDPPDPDRLRVFARRLVEWPNTSIRVKLESLWDIFQDVFPHRPRGIESGPWLLAALYFAEEQSIIRMPVLAGKRWDRTLWPPVPLSVDRILTPRSACRKNWQHFYWHRNLEWVTDLARLSSEEEKFLYKVHDGLVHGCFVEIAPLKYRSLQLTGHEKRLSVLMKGILFEPNRLTLELLACAPDYPPLAWEKINDLPSILVFENAAPMRVARDVLKSLLRPPYGMVGYGSGNSFVRSVQHLKDIEPLVSEIEYVGDLDSHGLNTARQACQRAIEVGLPSIVPAKGLHRLMIETAHLFGYPLGMTNEKHAKSTNCGGNELLIQWLPDEVRLDVLNILSAGNRVAEELLGPEELRRLWLVDDLKEDV